MKILEQEMKLLLRPRHQDPLDVEEENEIELQGIYLLVYIIAQEQIIKYVSQSNAVDHLGISQVKIASLCTSIGILFHSPNDQFSYKSLCHLTATCSREEKKF